jgi:SRSO17 transposase
MESRQEQGRDPGAVHRETGRPWTLWQTEVARRRGAQCARRDARWRAWASLRGLRSPVERNKGWQVAAVNGATTPYGVPHFVGRAVWDAEARRDPGRPYVVAPLGAPQAVLGVAETGLLTKGQPSAGVARQESGTAGRLAHGHIGVCLP